MVREMNLSPKQIDGLLKMAGSRLGRDPQQLRQQLESGNLQQITQGMNPQQQQQVAEILKDPQAIARFVENPQVQQMIAQLMKGR